MTEHPIPKTDKTLWIKILIGMALGVFLGLMLSPTSMALANEHTATSLGEWIALPGIIFLGLLKMVVIPLVISSIVLGMIALVHLLMIGIVEYVLWIVLD